MKKENIGQLYNADCINWSGVTEDTKEYYTEIISELIIKVDFDSIPTITRHKTYKSDTHSKIEMDFDKSNRDEENFAKRLYGLSFEQIGEIIDYQIPLKHKQNDKGIGKIDLLSFNCKKSILYLIELKFSKNQETLLKTMIECYTYYKTVDHKKLIIDFSGNIRIYKDEEQTVAIPLDPDKVKIHPAVMVVSTSNNSLNSFKELKEMENGKRPNIKALSEKLGMTFFSCDLHNIFSHTTFNS